MPLDASIMRQLLRDLGRAYRREERALANLSPLQTDYAATINEVHAAEAALLDYAKQIAFEEPVIP